jgi:hypothetical protein
MDSCENLTKLYNSLYGSRSGGRVNIGIKVTPKKKDVAPTSVNLCINIQQDAGRPPMLVGSVTSKAEKVEGLDKARASFTYALPQTKEVQNILKQGDPVVSLANLTEKDPTVRGIMHDLVSKAMDTAKI